MFGLLRRDRKPLTMILGAGASLHAGAPSTAELTRLVNQWSMRAGQGGGHICRQIITALRSNFRNVNFEVIINALEELEPLAAAYTHPDMADDFKPVTASFLLPGAPQVVYDPGVLSDVRHQLLHEIADRCRSCTHGSDVSVLKQLLGVLGADFSVRVFTLNYDDLIDRAGDLTDGFTTRHVPTGSISWAHEVLRFNAQEFARIRRAGKSFLAHLHGSVRFGYHIECEGVVKYERAVDAVASLYTSRASPSSDHGNILTAGPIISGFNKVAKLAGNPEPYAHYYAAFL